MAQASLRLRVFVRGDFQGGSGGGAPLVKICDHFGGSAPLKILALALLFKVFSTAMINIDK